MPTDVTERRVIPEAGPRPVSWILLAVAAVVIFLIGLVIGALSQRSSGAHVTATTTITEAAPTAKVPIAASGSTGELSQFGDGVYQVGVDIAAGNYHTDGGQDCYWERLSALSGGFSGIITNGEPTGPATVRVESSDKGFGVHGGCTWTAVP
jgi:hypothetical protein